MMKELEILNTEILSDDWYTLKRIDYAYIGRFGLKVKQSREAYDRGNGAVIFLYNKKTQSVILTKQFRMPTYINGNPTGYMIECCAGLLDQDNPEDCIKRETEEETGIRVEHVQRIFQIYMSPGSVTEILYFFVSAYSGEMRVSPGGGVAAENENIEVLEIRFQEGLNWIKTGKICDAKTILLFQYAQLNHLL